MPNIKCTCGQRRTRTEGFEKRATNTKKLVKVGWNLKEAFHWVCRLKIGRGYWYSCPQCHNSYFTKVRLSDQNNAKWLELLKGPPNGDALHD